MFVHGRITPNIKFAITYLYTWVKRVSVRVKCHNTMYNVKCRNTMFPARARTHIACVAGGSGYPRELRSRTWVQKAAQVARRMGRSLVKFRSRLRRSPKFRIRRKKFRACTHSPQLRRLEPRLLKIEKKYKIQITGCLHTDYLTILKWIINF